MLPEFKDIGKNAKDLVSKDYPTGELKIEAKTETENGIKFTTSGSQRNHDGNITGELKAEFTCHGVSVTKVYDSQNTVKITAEKKDVLTEGLRLKAEPTFVPFSGHRDVKLSAGYQNDHVHASTSVDPFKKQVNLSVVAGHGDCIVGGDITVRNGDVNQYGLAVGVSKPSHEVVLSAKDKLNTFSGSYYHLVNKDLQATASAIWNRKDNNTIIELGGAYRLDKDASMKAKVDTTGKASWSYSQTLRPGIKATFSTQIDTTKFGEGGHQVGLSLNFCA